MSYLKAITLSALVALAIIFMVQNIEALSHPLSIRLNLVFLKLESSAYATYLLILLAFFVGLLAASLLGIVERFGLRKTIRDQQKQVEGLNKELSSLRNLPLTGAPAASGASTAAAKQEDAGL
ncbi:MAG: LapA family protein [Desulfarculus sp.]|nr:LapA family protein [Desulfarculus sp.]